MIFWYPNLNRVCGFDMHLPAASVKYCSFAEFGGKARQIVIYSLDKKS